MVQQALLKALPPEDGQNLYRIKGISETFERMATKIDQIEAEAEATAELGALVSARTRTSFALPPAGTVIATTMSLAAAGFGMEQVVA